MTEQWGPQGPGRWVKADESTEWRVGDWQRPDDCDVLFLVLGIDEKHEYPIVVWGDNGRVGHNSRAYKLRWLPDTTADTTAPPIAPPPKPQADAPGTRTVPSACPILEGIGYQGIGDDRCFRCEHAGACALYEERVAGPLRVKLASVLAIEERYDKEATEARNILRAAGIAEIDRDTPHPAGRAMQIPERIGLLVAERDGARAAVVNRNQKIDEIRAALRCPEDSDPTGIAKCLRTWIDRATAALEQFGYAGQGHNIGFIAEDVAEQLLNARAEVERDPKPGSDPEPDDEPGPEIDLIALPRPEDLPADYRRKVWALESRGIAGGALLRALAECQP